MEKGVGSGGAAAGGGIGDFDVFADGFENGAGFVEDGHAIAKMTGILEADAHWFAVFGEWCELLAVSGLPFGEFFYAISS